MKTILIVEDELSIVRMLATILREEEYAVIVAADGVEALELLRDNRPDMILSDMMMPVMGGVELIRRLRADPVTAAIPILSVSGDWQLAVGADAALAKPYQHAELLEVAESLLQKGRGTK